MVYFLWVFKRVACLAVFVYCLVCLPDKLGCYVEILLFYFILFYMSLGIFCFCICIFVSALHFYGFSHDYDYYRYYVLISMTDFYALL